MWLIWVLHKHSLADIDQAFNLCADLWHNFTQDKKYNAPGCKSNSCSVGSLEEWQPWRVSGKALKFSKTFPETIYSWVWAIFVQFKPSKHWFSTFSLKDPVLSVWRISNFKNANFWAHCASGCCYCPFPEMYSRHVFDSANAMRICHLSYVNSCICKSGMLLRDNWPLTD